MPPLPAVTKALMLVCTAMFCIMGLVPAVGQWLALWPLGSGLFMPWQPFTYGLLHADMWHLFFNMLGLWMFGAELEYLWGPRRYAQFVLACVLAAATCQALMGLLGLGGPTIGISGAVYGMLLASALLFPNRVVMPLFPPIPMKQRTFVMVFGGLELLQGLGGFGGAAHFAHLGGMAGAWVIMQHWRRRLPWQQPRR